MNISIPETKYIHFLTNLTQNPVLIVMIRRYLCFFKTVHRPFQRIFILGSGFYMIYRLHVTYSDKVSFRMFIKVKCLLLCDSRCHFRLLSALPVKSSKIAIFFYSSLVYMRPIFSRYFLFLMIGNTL